MGNLRVTTSDALMLDLLAPIIASFQASNPFVNVDAIIGNCLLNLARGKRILHSARSPARPGEIFLAARLATIAWAAYGRRVDFVGGRPLPNDVYQRRWLSYGKNLAGLKAHDFVQKRVPSGRIVFRSDSVAGIAPAIAAGMGVEVLTLHAWRSS